MMVTPDKAEDFATTQVEEYLMACQCASPKDVGNALLKLASVVGQAMVASQGQDTAIAMMQGVTNHIAKKRFGIKAKNETIQ